MKLESATIGQILVPVEDLEKAVAYYRDVLGLPFLFTAPPQMAFFGVGATRLLVGVLPEGQPRLRAAAIYFEVQDIQAVHQTLENSGVRFLAKPHVVNRTPSGELWLAEFTDPDGNQLALMSEVATART
jgi:methylmalonyl-CoA/ethylmalonyl-CoA epimerase